MEKIVKKSAQEKAYDALRLECMAGKWQGKLPGARTLGASLGVSPPTVLNALAELAAEGLLIRSGNKKAYQISDEFSKHRISKTEPRQKLVLILTPTPMEDMNETTRRVVKHLKSILTDQHWKIKELVIAYGNAKKRHQAWDNLIDIDENIPIIAVAGTPAIADWAAHHKMRILFIGGILDGRDGTIVAVSSTKIAVEAIDSLIALGHRRIALPLNDRPEEFKTSIKSVLQTRIESLGEVYQSSYHNPEGAYFSREAIRETMKMYAKSSMPTGLIVLDWWELLTVYCCLSEMGLKVPQDVSLILLNDQSDAEWFTPELTRYAFPLDEFAKAVKTWLSEVSGRSQEILLPPTLINGASIGPPSQ